MGSREDWHDKIDNYSDTIYALVGYANFYRFDDSRRTIRKDVLVVQGWRFTPIPTGDSSLLPDVTPDLAILANGFVPVVVEAKKSFPKDRGLWQDDFVQLEKYGQPLDGWPNKSGRVDNHDVVLLVHQSRSAAVIKYLKESVSLGRVRFKRQPCIVEFNRSSERQPYFFFRCQDGLLSDAVLADKLNEGTQVPMVALLAEYSTVKLYDALAPMPYFLQVIWDNIIAGRAAAIKPLVNLRKRQKVEVTIALAELTDELRNKFTFRSLCPLAGC
jgi:hypothetical protein